MMLRQIVPDWREEIAKNDSFNVAAADAAYSMVMKMTRDEAEMFTTIVVSDMLEDYIEKNLRTVQGMVDETMDKTLSDAKRAIIRKSAGREEALGYAQAIALIEKARKNPYDYGYVWDENDFRRGPDGRFQSKTKISHSQKKPISGKTAQSMGIAKPPKASNGKKLTAGQRAQFQDEYRQIAGFLSTVQDSMRNPGDARINYTVQNKRTGRTHTEVRNGTKADNSVWDPSTEMVTEVSVNPGALTAGGATMALTHALGGSENTAVRAGQVASNVERGTNQFAQNWNQSARDPKNTNQHVYGRISAGSELLGTVAPTSAKAQTAAAFGRFVGNSGPQAEEVFGPTARKTAYRYRGTEKTPDKALVSEYGKAVNRAKSMTLREKGDRAPMQMGMDRVASERRAPTMEERAAGLEALEQALQKKLPKKNLTNLQLASGNTPPSEGVLLNKDGQIVSQAVGYGDDHYLPFNLKNLKSLKGGEYIRTRSYGGLTSEDIYTGLVAGARRVTVVSHSGTFSVQFDDDLRGGRRHNDKARRMTRRYEQILDAVQSEKVDRGPIPKPIQDRLRAKVNQEYSGMPEADKRAEFKRRVEEYRESPELTDIDQEFLSTIETRAMNAGQDAQEYVRQARAQLMEAKKTRFTLDGDGYAAAQEALREQFPYYITTTAKPKDTRDEFMNPSRDRGYVEPGRNRPTAAQGQGLFGTEVNPGRKRQGLAASTASHMNYQRGRFPEQRATAAAAAAGGAAGGAGGSGGGDAPRTPSGGGSGSGGAKTQPATREDVKERIQETQEKRTYEAAALNLRNRIRGNFEQEDLKDPVFSVNDQEFTRRLSDPAFQRDFELKVEQIRSEPSLAETHKGPLTQYQASSMLIANDAYNPALGTRWTDRPFKFTKEERKAADKYANTTGFVHEKPLKDMTQSELSDEVEIVSDILAAVSDSGVRGADVLQLGEGRFSGLNEKSPHRAKVLSSEAGAHEYLKTVHAMRVNNLRREKAAERKNEAGSKPQERPRTKDAPQARAQTAEWAETLGRAAQKTNDPEKAERWENLAANISASLASNRGRPVLSRDLENDIVEAYSVDRGFEPHETYMSDQ